MLLVIGMKVYGYYVRGEKPLTDNWKKLFIISKLIKQNNNLKRNKF